MAIRVYTDEGERQKTENEESEWKNANGRTELYEHNNKILKNTDFFLKKKRILIFLFK